MTVWISINVPDTLIQLEVHRRTPVTCLWWLWGIVYNIYIYTHTYMYIFNWIVKCSILKHWQIMVVILTPTTHWAGLLEQQMF